MNDPVTDKSVRKGIKTLSKKEIDTIQIEIKSDGEIFEYLVQGNAAKQIYELALSVNEISSIAIFKLSVAAIRKEQNGINQYFQKKDGNALYYLGENGKAKVTVNFVDNEHHSSREVAAALQELFCIHMPQHSPDTSQPGTVSSSTGVLLFVPHQEV